MRIWLQTSVAHDDTWIQHMLMITICSSRKIKRSFLRFCFLFQKLIKLRSFACRLFSTLPLPKNTKRNKTGIHNTNTGGCFRKSSPNVNCTRQLLRGWESLPQKTFSSDPKCCKNVRFLDGFSSITNQNCIFAAWNLQTHLISGRLVFQLQKDSAYNTRDKSWNI